MITNGCLEQRFCNMMLRVILLICTCGTTIITLLKLLSRLWFLHGLLQLKGQTLRQNTKSNADLNLPYQISTTIQVEVYLSLYIIYFEPLRRFYIVSEALNNIHFICLAVQCSLFLMRRSHLLLGDSLESIQMA